MSLWGNKDLVYSAGTVQVNLGTSTAQVIGTGTTFTTSGISTGDVMTIGVGATYGYAVITGFTSTTISIASTAGIVTGITTVPSGTTYFVSQEPIYNLKNSIYRAPEAKTTGFSTSPVTTAIYGVDANEVAVAAVTTVGGKASAYAVAHSGWVGIMTYIDTHGNLRVKSEVFVAGGINPADEYDAPDDSVYPDALSITITSQPASVGVGTTQTATFSVAASAVPSYATISYQWQQNAGSGFSNLVGFTTTSVSIANTNTSKNGYTYRAIVSVGDVSVTSGIATMTVS